LIALTALESQTNRVGEPGWETGEFPIKKIPAQQKLLKKELDKGAMGKKAGKCFYYPGPKKLPNPALGTLTNRMWFSVVCTLIENAYAASQWSKCCGLTRHSRLSPQQILTTVMRHTRCR